MSIGIRISVLLLVFVLGVSLLPALSPGLPVQAAESWVKDTQNPVVAGDPGLVTGEPAVIYDSTARLYRMWYTRVSDGSADFNSAVNTLLAAAGPDLVANLKAYDFPSIAAEDYAAVKDVISRLAVTNTGDPGYIDIEAVIMGFSPVIVAATSPDGVEWTAEPGSFSGTPGEWDAFGVTSPSVIRNSASDYEMWYTGWNFNPEDFRQLFIHLDELEAEEIGTLLTDFLVDRDLADLFTHIEEAGGDDYLETILEDISDILTSSGGSIGRAVSTDGGATWTKTGAVLLRGEEDAWDNYGVYSPSVIKTPSGYRMWYTGFTVDFSPLIDLKQSGSAAYSDLKNALAEMPQLQIGRTVSADGIDWVKDPAPVMDSAFGVTPEAGTFNGVVFPSVLLDSAGKYHMWYTEVSGSPDSLLDFLEGTLSFNSAVFTGMETSIRYATSRNGTSWSSQSAVLLQGGEADWDNRAVAAPCVIQRSNQFKMWYTGYSLTSPNSLIEGLLDGDGIKEALSASNTRTDIGLATISAPRPPSGGGGGSSGGGTPPYYTLSLTGLETSVSARLDSQGIMQYDILLRNQDGSLSITIPNGTKLMSSQGTRLTSLTLGAPALPPTPPPDNALIQTIDLGPNGASFNPYLILSLKYDPARLPAGVTEESLRIAYWDGTTWQYLRSVVDKSSHTASVHVTHFTTFVLLGQIEKAVVPPPVSPTSEPPAPPTTSPSLVEPEETGEPEPTPPFSTFSWWFFVIIFVVVFSIAFLVLMSVRGRRRS
ncbi:MAG: hypothetical protein PHU23_01045 [Dehalococcoidales bacterium]|nr:hypothetical protein [Dehalococcoidales bacterium]